MPEPIEYRIVQSLQTALRGISVAGGYHYDIATLAVKLDPDVDVETLIGDTPLRPFVVLEVPPDQHAIKFAPNGVQITMPFLVHAVRATDPTDDNSLAQTAYRLYADVEQAVLQDMRRGGLALDTVVTTRQVTKREGVLLWVTVTAQVRVVRTWGKPNG